MTSPRKALALALAAPLFLSPTLLSAQDVESDSTVLGPGLLIEDLDRVLVPAGPERFVGGSHTQWYLQEYPEGLEFYLYRLAATPPGMLEAAPRRVQLAFWINAYNACALKLVVDNYPISKASFPASLVRSLQGVPGNSIRQISDTWSRKFCAVAGADRALDEIEHAIIRPMGDPRIHFAVNCASRSCPALIPELYDGDTLDVVLAQQTRIFLADKKHNTFDLGTLRAELSSIFRWYKTDFEPLQAFLAEFAPTGTYMNC